MRQLVAHFVLRSLDWVHQAEETVKVYIGEGEMTSDVGQWGSSDTQELCSDLIEYSVVRNPVGQCRNSLVGADVFKISYSWLRVRSGIYITVSQDHIQSIAGKDAKPKPKSGKISDAAKHLDPRGESLGHGDDSASHEGLGNMCSPRKSATSGRRRRQRRRRKKGDLVCEGNALTDLEAKALTGGGEEAQEGQAVGEVIVASSDELPNIRDDRELGVGASPVSRLMDSGALHLREAVEGGVGLPTGLLEAVEQFFDIDPFDGDEDGNGGLSNNGNGFGREDGPELGGSLPSDLRDDLTETGLRDEYGIDTIYIAVPAPQWTVVKDRVRFGIMYTFAKGLEDTCHQRHGPGQHSCWLPVPDDLGGQKLELVKRYEIGTSHSQQTG